MFEKPESPKTPKKGDTGRNSFLAFHNSIYHSSNKKIKNVENYNFKIRRDHTNVFINFNKILAIHEIQSTFHEQYRYPVDDYNYDCPVPKVRIWVIRGCPEIAFSKRLIYANNL